MKMHEVSCGCISALGRWEVDGTFGLDNVSQGTCPESSFGLVAVVLGQFGPADFFEAVMADSGSSPGRENKFWRGVNGMSGQTRNVVLAQTCLTGA